jgi:hypothetical protein
LGSLEYTRRGRRLLQPAVGATRACEKARPCRPERKRKPEECIPRERDAQLAKTGDFRRQSEAQNGRPSPTKNPGKPAVFGVFRGSSQDPSKMEARGFEPLTDSPEGRASQGVAPLASEPLAQTLARESQIDPSLARVVDAWPKLPEAIRKAMLALADSCTA